MTHCELGKETTLLPGVAGEYFLEKRALELGLKEE